MPNLSMKLIQLIGRFLNWLRPGLDARLLVRIGNRHFRRAFALSRYADRVLFLPYCLRPKFCPAELDRQKGLLCDGICKGCRLGELRQYALKLGYGQVYIVPSSTQNPTKSLLPSSEFIQAKIGQHRPAAALGVVCDWHLKKRLIPEVRVGRSGFTRGEAPPTVLQGLLLSAKKCRGAAVDWEAVKARLALKEA